MASDKGNQSAGLHRNHRLRLKRRYLNEGISGFEPHNILELLLFFTIPQKDTNDLAHELLNRFGSIPGVFDAPIEELLKVKGVGMHTATLIKLIPDLWQVYERDRAAVSRRKINSTVAAASYLAPLFTGRSTEAMAAVALDASSGLLGAEILAEGSPMEAPIDARRICEWAINIRAGGIILAHNHLGSGNCKPSGPDCEATRRLAAVLNGLGIRLIDHIILCGGEYFSMADNPAFTPLLTGKSAQSLIVQKQLYIKKLPLRSETED